MNWFHYQPHNHMEVIGDDNYISYFMLEQIHLDLSLITLNPALHISWSWFPQEYQFDLLSFLLLAVLLHIMSLFAKLHTFITLRPLIRRLAFHVITNQVVSILQLILWITLFTHFSTNQFETACSVGCGFILLNSLANQYTSHISHL